MNRIIFNGKSSSEYGLYVSGEGTFNSPELDTISYSIPGRSGDIIVSNKRYKNVLVKYPAFIRANFKANAAKVRAWLLQPQGYCRLEDSYHPDEFRLAKFSGPLDFEMRFLNQSGTCELLFDCKPQRFLTSGEDPVDMEAGAVLINPTLFYALPLIKISGTGAGTITVGQQTVSFSDIDEHVILDCDSQNAYKGLENKNSTMTGAFPELAPGENIISWDGDITAVEITPRWWTV